MVDFDSGADAAVAPADRSPFSGGKRVLVEGLLSRGQVLAVAAVAYALAVASGVAIVTGREPRVLWIGVAGLALAYFYHAPPVRLSPAQAWTLGSFLLLAVGEGLGLIFLG